MTKIWGGSRINEWAYLAHQVPLDVLYGNPNMTKLSKNNPSSLKVKRSMSHHLKSVKSQRLLFKQVQRFRIIIHQVEKVKGQSQNCSVASKV